jgi:hypothetical protein
LHTYLSTFGPQQKVFQPPQRPLQLQGMHPIAQTLRQAHIEEASMVRIVAGEEENLLQVTQSPDLPRRYFSLRNGAELKNHDHAQALFLARYYMADPDAPVHEVRKIDQFTDEYPSVNRLLPVYRVAFKREDGLVVFVYTETSVLAGVNNELKTQLQQIFRVVHSGSGLGAIHEGLRVVLMGGLLLTVLGTALAGVALLSGIRRSKPAPGVKHWHRGGAYVLSLPLLALAVSGLWHLLQNAGPKPPSNLRLSAPMKVDQMNFDVHQQWDSITKGLRVQGLSCGAQQRSQCMDVPSDLGQSRPSPANTR